MIVNFAKLCVAIRQRREFLELIGRLLPNYFF